MGNSPPVLKLRACDPEGVEAGARGRLQSGCVRLPPPPHPAHPTAAATTSCPAGGRELLWGYTDPGPALAPLPCPSAPGTSAVFPTAGPRHPGSQRRTLLCHTDLDRFLFNSAIPHLNSGLKWSCRSPGSTPVLGCRVYLCRKEVGQSVHSSNSHGCANTFLLSALHASSAKLCTPAGTRELVRRVP